MNKRLCDQSCKIGPFHSDNGSPLLSLLLFPFELEGRGGDVKCYPATLPCSLPELPEGWIALTGGEWGKMQRKLIHFVKSEDASMVLLHF